MTRASMLDILGQDLVRTARAKGLADAVVVNKHGLKAALIPVVTAVALQVGLLIGGPRFVAGSPVNIEFQHPG
jgi:peptide/nickel transport system permease protein